MKTVASVSSKVTSCLCVLCVLCVDSSPQSQSSTIYGFTTSSSAQQRALERRFLPLPSPDQARAAHAFLTAEPHVAGSPRDRVLADWIRDRWREYGLEQIEITEHEVLLPYVTETVVETTLRQAQAERESVWRASLKEEPVAGDPFTARDTGIPYHAY
jgi:N-acetylated-alpha-linked acidic dipeptidase